MNRNINIKVVEQQSEELHPCELSQGEIDAFLYRYNNDSNKNIEKVRTPVPHQKRINMDIDTQKSNNEYYDIRYVGVDDVDGLNLKIEIRSDMKL